MVDEEVTICDTVRRYIMVSRSIRPCLNTLIVRMGHVIGVDYTAPSVTRVTDCVIRPRFGPLDDEFGLDVSMRPAGHVARRMLP